ncbi:hypothetical protein JYU20_03825 [Bacteroidales bacterium AH-315-I05]|nr:hypothetical protein [Bacteroidales bacterium AH-315-I05]
MRFTLFILLIALTSVNAQTHFIKGHVIWNNGDTLKGRIDNRGFTNRILIFVHNEKQKIKTKDIIEYTRGTELFRRFDQKSIFLKREQEGRIEYYSVIIKDHDFAHHMMYLVKGGIYYNISGPRFKKIMAPLLTDYEGKNEQISNMKFQRQEILQLINIYNLSFRDIPNAKN